MKRRRDLKYDVVDRDVVEFLHKLGIWIPEEILPKNTAGEPIGFLKKKNDKLEATKKEFWIPVGFIPERTAPVRLKDGEKVWFEERIKWKDHSVWSWDEDLDKREETNKTLIREVLLALSVWRLPISIKTGAGDWVPHPTETATGIAFVTWFYRQHQALCYNFMQVLQDQKLCSEGAKRWDFVRTTIAPGKNHFAIMTIKDWNWGKVDETADPKQQEAGS